MQPNRFKLSRRRLLRAAAAAGGVALAQIAGAAEQKKKYSKEKVGYRDEPYQRRSCAMCVLYAGNGECAIVEGPVSPQGWCVQWTPATMGKAAAARTA